MKAYALSADTRGIVDAPAEAVFAFLDDQANLSAHMSKPSAMMLGSVMDIHMEADHTRSVGSRFGFTGRVLGIPLAVKEVVTERAPPLRKTWQTIQEPRLWVIGAYQMGFELTPEGERSAMKVHIRFDLPKSGFQRLLGRLFGPIYAKWCTGQMVRDAARHFQGYRGAEGAAKAG